MALKTYVLLEHTNSSAQVYLQVNAAQRVRLEKRPVDHAYGQITFMDRDGKNKTIRLKLSTDEIFLQNQIKPDIGIPANEKYTQSERDSLMFRDGVLMTSNPTVQKYLETSPQFEDFWNADKDPEKDKQPNKKGRVGACPDIRQPLYKLYDKTVELRSNNEMFKKRVAAANKIMAIQDVTKGQELMYRLNGSFFKAPDDLLEITDQLVSFLDSADEAMLDALLKDDTTIDEKTTMLLGKAMAFGIISFDLVPNKIVKVNGEKVVALKEISSEYSPEERKRYFCEFLTSEDGKLLMQDIQNLVTKAEKKVEAVAV